MGTAAATASTPAARRRTTVPTSAPAHSLQRLGIDLCSSSASAASYFATWLCLLLRRCRWHGSSTGGLWTGSTGGGGISSNSPRNPCSHCGWTNKHYSVPETSVWVKLWQQLWGLPEPGPVEHRLQEQLWTVRVSREVEHQWQQCRALWGSS